MRSLGAPGFGRTKRTRGPTYQRGIFSQFKTVIVVRATGFRSLDWNLFHPVQSPLPGCQSGSHRQQNLPGHLSVLFEC